MRGTPADIPRNPRQTGIIPAYAGNTFHMTSIMVHRRDHPRVCGEHEWKWYYDKFPQGSSPRMRGTLAYFRVERRYYGIIPAYAGNTELPRDWRDTFWDHPRVCGEHRAFIKFCAVNLGSSPRMRGTHYKSGRTVYGTGIIPAYAGNTDIDFVCPCDNGDHPRVCGEHHERLRFRHAA